MTGVRGSFMKSGGSITCDARFTNDEGDVACGVVGIYYSTTCERLVNV